MFIGGSVPLSVTRGQPHSVSVPIYRIRMESESKKIVRANVLELLVQKGGKLPPGQTGVTRLKDLGVSHGNAQRTLAEDQDMTLNTLDQVARALHRKPWELLMPDMAKNAMWLSAADHIKMFSPDIQTRLTSLDEGQIRMLEKGMSGVLAMVERPHAAAQTDKSKSKRTAGKRPPRESTG